MSRRERFVLLSEMGKMKIFGVAIVLLLFVGMAFAWTEALPKPSAAVKNETTFKYAIPSWTAKPMTGCVFELNFLGKPVYGYLSYDWWTNTTKCYPYAIRGHHVATNKTVTME